MARARLLACLIAAAVLAEAAPSRAGTQGHAAERDAAATRRDTGLGIRRAMLENEPDRRRLQLVPPTPFTLFPFNPLTTAQLWGAAVLQGTLLSAFLPRAAARRRERLLVDDPDGYLASAYYDDDHFYTT